MKNGKLLEVNNLTKVFTKGQGFVKSTIEAVSAFRLPWS